MSGHFNDVTRRSAQCKICCSPYHDEVNSMIEKGTSQKDVMSWLLSQENPINVSKATMSRHASKHNLNHLKILPSDVTENTEEGKDPEISSGQVLAMADFLDLVISKVNKQVESGDLKPTITEAIKAADIKSKIKEGSKVEKELLNFIMEVSNRGHSNQA